MAHIEAGLRSFDRAMPDEINRVVADHLSAFLFCPTETAIKNLRAEGISKGIFQFGDMMKEALEFYCQVASTRSGILERMAISSGGYLVITVHRPIAII